MIRQNAFKKMAPRIAPELLPEGFGQKAINVNTDRGTLRPYRGNTFVWTPTKAGEIKTIYKFGNYWFHWLEDVDVVKGPVHGDVQERTYFTGVGAPKVTDASIAVSGGTNYPVNSYTLGIPAPATPPTVPSTVVAQRGGTVTSITNDTEMRLWGTAFDGAKPIAVGDKLVLTELVATQVGDGLDISALNGKTVTVTAVTDSYVAISENGSNYKQITGGVSGLWDYYGYDASVEARVYVVTNVSAWGEEGPPSPASEVVSVFAGAPVQLSNIPGPPSGNYNITHQRIYRSVTGSGHTDFQFVGEILASETSFTDNVKIPGETMVSAEWFPPPETLKGLKVHPGGFLVGFDGYDICVSDAHVPSGWPERYRITVEFPIVGLGIFGNSILVCTEGNPFIITGSSPDALISERIDIAQACVSKRSIVDMGSAVAYAAPDGLMMIGMGLAKNATAEIMTREDWQALNPSSIFGTFHNDKYYGFYDGGAFVFDPVAGDFGLLDITATAAYTHLESDTLYLVNGTLDSFDTGADLSMTWKSKRYVIPSKCPPSAKVTARDYPLTFRLYIDGVLKYEKEVTNGWPFRLPGGYLGETLEFEIEGNKEVIMVQIGAVGEMI